MNAATIQRLRRAGLKRHHSVLDYGCGFGRLVDALTQRGFRNVVGYDPYQDRFKDRAVLGRAYDMVILQDVIEHVDDPAALLDDVVRLTRPGGTIIIGTPDATNLDLSTPENVLHSLHQPYHIHILSLEALRRITRDHNLREMRVYRSSYNTFVPFLNMRFSAHYAALHDNTLDLAFEPLKLTPAFFSPKSLVIGFFGGFIPPATEVMLVLLRPE